MDKIVNYAKQYGFVYQGSEIYNGLANTWDYGPLGVELKNNIKQLWWNDFVKRQVNVVGLDSSIILNSDVWNASGHIGGFNDPLMDCKSCHSRHRADKLVEAHDNDLNCDGWSNEQLMEYIVEHKLVCPDCGALDYTDIRQFNLMFKTNMGVLEDERSRVYLRPETAQGIFVNYKNILRTSRKKVPFGVGQIGKSFRNEITPGNFIFRTREFEQMELEFFCKPGSEFEWFDYYQEQIGVFLSKLGIKDDSLRVVEHEGDALAHYSNKTIDYEFKFPFGFGELWGLASRTNFDLSAHQDKSGHDMSYLEPGSNERFIPYVIEPAVGVDRLFLAVLCDAYDQEDLEGEIREVMRFSPLIAPIQVCIMPLVKKLSAEALEVLELLSGDYRVEFDDAGTIGKRYRRQDVIGTPYCVTFDYDSLDDLSVTVRNRDDMKQSRVAISDLSSYIGDCIRDFNA